MQSLPSFPLPRSFLTGPLRQLLDMSEAPIASMNSLNMAAAVCHEANVKAGFYTNIFTGKPLDRNLGEMICLIHSELSESLEGVRKDKMDEHLPHRKAEEVEMADAIIRILDYAGYRNLDLVGAVIEKMAYNRNRADHKLANRAADGGKKF